MGYKSKYTGAQVDAALDKANTALQEHQDISGKQDVISDLATIRSGASKGATALQSVPSEYVTETELNEKGYATTSAMNTALEDKVDKVSGKQLSTEDFTTALKTKLNGLSNYDDTAISNAVNKLRTDFDTLVSGDTTTAIKTFNEVIAFLDGISDSEDLESIIASIEQQIASKQDKIDDLATIRSGAALGATALQSYTEKYTGTYTKPSTGIPKTDLASSVQGSLDKADSALQSYTETDPVFKASAASGITSDDITNWNSKTSNVGTVTSVKINNSTKSPSNGVVDLGTVITEHQDISGKVDKVDGKGLSTNDYTTTEKNKLAGIAEGAEVNVQSDWNATSGDAFIKNKPTLATVATSGSYNDLSNKPTIPSAITIDSSLSSTSTNPVQNKVINSALSGKYSKPSGGIPNSDLANSKITISGTAVSLGGSITQSALRTALGLGSNAYTSTSYLPSAGGSVSGYISIGTYLSVGTTLSVKGAATFEGRINMMNGGLIYGANSSGTYQACFYPRFNDTTYLNYGTKGFYLRNNSSTEIMVINASDETTFKKDVTVSGTFSNPSSLVLKNVIDRDGLTLEQLSKIKPTRFTWNDKRDDDVHIGGIADEVKEVMPEVIHEQEDGTYTMEYANAAFAMVSSLVKYVEQNQKRIEELEKEIAELKKRL